MKITDAGGESSCGIPGQSGEDDDLPWSTAKIYEPSPLGMFNRECVDFALWRVNQQLGSTTAPYKFLNGTFRPDGAAARLGPDLEGRLGRQGLAHRRNTTCRRGRLVLPRHRGRGRHLRPRRRRQSRQRRRQLPRRGLQRQPRPERPHLLHPHRRATALPAPFCTCPAALTGGTSETHPDSPRGPARVHGLRAGIQHNTRGTSHPALPPPRRPPSAQAASPKHPAAQHRPPWASPGTRQAKQPRWKPRPRP